MQFTINTTAKARPSFADPKVLVKPVISVTLNLATVQPVPASVKEAIDAHAAAAARLESLLKEAGVETLEAFEEVCTATQGEAMEVNKGKLAASMRIIQPTLNASALALALQGVGKHAPYMTKALKRAIRGAWLLDETEEG